MANLARRNADWDSLERLFAKYLDGEKAATEGLFRELTRVLTGYFVARIRSESESADLTQATLLKIHFARDRYDSSLSLKTWVFTIASRSLVDHWRGAAAESKRRAADTLEEGDEFSSALDALPSEDLDPAMKTELHGDLNRALETLKPIDRSIVYLYGVEGMSMAEIAGILELTEGAAKLRAHRAYQSLRKILVLLVLFFFREGF